MAQKKVAFCGGFGATPGTGWRLNRAVKQQIQRPDLTVDNGGQLKCKFQQQQVAMPPYEAAWRTPSRQVALSSSEVHLWRACLDEPRLPIEWFESILSAEERTRANRFRFVRDRRRFVAGRGILRAILGDCLYIAPQEVRFTYGTHGKPAIAAPISERRFCFNASHSREVGLYAVAWDAEVGVDVEYVWPLADFRNIVERYFSPREQAILHAVPPNRTLVTFYTLWTRKEAYLKAIGDGLSLAPEQFSVSLALCGSSALSEVAWDTKAHERWFLCGVEPAAGCVGALCVEGHERRLVFWEAPF